MNNYYHISVIITRLATQQPSNIPDSLTPNPLLLGPLGVMAQDYRLDFLPHHILENH
jgi:hypothetical protein